MKINPKMLKVIIASCLIAAIIAAGIITYHKISMVTVTGTPRYKVGQFVFLKDSCRQAMIRTVVTDYNDENNIGYIVYVEGQLYWGTASQQDVVVDKSQCIKWPDTLKSNTL